jgi:hypothetical protein
MTRPTPIAPDEPIAPDDQLDPSRRSDAAVHDQAMTRPTPIAPDDQLDPSRRSNAAVHDQAMTRPTPIATRPAKGRHPGADHVPGAYMRRSVMNSAIAISDARASLGGIGSRAWSASRTYARATDIP